MKKFIEVHDTILNVEDIRKIEFLGDDVYLGLFPKGKGKQFISDYVIFNFAQIYTFDGSMIVLSIDLYLPEEGETEEEWIDKNRSYIAMAMNRLHDILKPECITENEYISEL